MHCFTSTSKINLDCSHLFSIYVVASIFLHLQLHKIFLNFQFQELYKLAQTVISAHFLKIHCKNNLDCIEFLYIFNFTRFSFNFQFQELYQLAQTVIGAHLMPIATMANIEAKLLLHNSVLMPMPPRLITLLYKNAKGQSNSLEKYGKKMFNY